MATTGSKSHYNDWPNTYGFDVRYQELEPTELEVAGTIPAYTAGVLFRNGLGPRDVDDKKGKTVYRVSHWFDNLSQVHRFQIHPPTAEHPRVRVTHNSRLACDEAIARIRRTGRREEFTFGAKRDPCQSFFQKAQSFFKPMPLDSPSCLAIGVSFTVNYPGLSSHGTKLEKPLEHVNLINKSDHAYMQTLDPETLEPIGIAAQSVLHKDLSGPVGAAHACVDPVTGDVFNYNLAFGQHGTYRVFGTSAATGKTEVLAAIKAVPAYLHSFFLTEHYVVLCVWNAHFGAGGASLLLTRNHVDAMSDWDATKPAMWYIVDRTPARRGLVAVYESDAFFCFHSINAYEEPNPDDATKTDIVLDAPVYDNLDCLKRFYIDNMLSDSAGSRDYRDLKSRPFFRRYRLPQLPSKRNNKPIKAVVEFSGEQGFAPELPSIHPAYMTKKHRYVYGTIDSGQSSFLDGLVKLDTETREKVLWREHAQTPSEPIFVPDPEKADKEDGGVLLSVVLDGARGKSYLLVLDAETMKEIGRASVDGVVGFGFHGAFVSGSAGVSEVKITSEPAPAAEATPASEEPGEAAAAKL